MMPWAVGHERDEPLPATGLTGLHGVQQIANLLNNVKVAAFVAAADIIGFTSLRRLYFPLNLRSPRQAPVSVPPIPSCHPLET
jgi:hypothetical protein